MSETQKPAPAPDMTCADGNPKCNDHLCHPVCRWKEKTSATEPAPDVDELVSRARKGRKSKGRRPQDRRVR